MTLAPTLGSGDQTRQEVAIVTGGARGIGAATVLALHRAGFRVVVVDIDDEGARATLDAIGGESAGHLAVHADLNDVEAIAECVTSIHTMMGRIDVLVNNAGITHAIDFFDVTPHDWDGILALNARGSFFMMQAVAKVMSPGGRIVNVASIAGKGWKETSNIAYAGSKGAVLAMTRIAAAALGKRGIRVNAICPGLTKTELMMGFVEGRAAAEGSDASSVLESLAAQVPLGILNESGDVAEGIVFLASAASRTITGQSINIDGGIVFD